LILHVNRQTILPIIFILLFGMGFSLYFRQIQAPNHFGNIKLADANEYLKIYEYFRGDRQWHNIRFGIHNRVTIPFLASLLPSSDASFNFFVVNSLLAILALLSIYQLLIYVKITQIQIYLVMLFFSLHYVGPFRQNAINPINVDIGVYLFETLFLILLLRKKYLLLILIAPIAVATKEVMLALYIVIFAIGLLSILLFQDKPLNVWLLLIMLMVGLFTKWSLNELFPSSSSQRNSLLVMAFHLRELLLHPDHLWRWFLSLFAAFGAYLFLFRIRKLRRIRSSDQLIIHSLSASVLLLSILGGMDYTRIIFLGFPYVITSLLLISGPGKIAFLLASLLSLILSRFWMPVTNITDDLTPYYAWMPESANVQYLLIWSVVVLLSFAVYQLTMKSILRLFQT